MKHRVECQLTIDKEVFALAMEIDSDNPPSDQRRAIELLFDSGRETAFEKLNLQETQAEKTLPQNEQ